MSDEFYYPYPDVTTVFDQDKVQLLLGFGTQELEQHFLHGSIEELDAISAQLLALCPLSEPHHFKLCVLDLANLRAECHTDWVHHEPQLYVMLLDASDESWRYVAPYEGKRDNARDFLNNVRKVQDYLAQVYDLSQPHLRYYATPDLIIGQRQDDLSFLEQLIAANYDCVVDFQEGSTIAHDIKIWSLMLGFLDPVMAHPTPEVRDKVAIREVPRSMQPKLHVNEQKTSLNLNIFIGPSDIEELRPHFQRVADIMIECGEQDPSTINAISADYHLEFSLVTRYFAADGTIHFERNDDAIDLASCLGALMVLGSTIKKQEPYNIYCNCMLAQNLAYTLAYEEEVFTNGQGFHTVEPEALLKLLKILSICNNLEIMGCLKEEEKAD